VISAINGADPDERMTISLYYNDKIDPERLEPISKELQESFDELEFDIRYGGQHTALLLIGLE
jgi:hypothetical protein